MQIYITVLKARLNEPDIATIFFCCVIRSFNSIYFNRSALAKWESPLCACNWPSLCNISIYILMGLCSLDCTRVNTPWNCKFNNSKLVAWLLITLSRSRHTLIYVTYHYNHTITIWRQSVCCFRCVDLYLIHISIKINGNVFVLDDYYKT